MKVSGPFKAADSLSTRYAAFRHENALTYRRQVFTRTDSSRSMHCIRWLDRLARAGIRC